MYTNCQGHPATKPSLPSIPPQPDGDIPQLRDFDDCYSEGDAPTFPLAPFLRPAPHIPSGSSPVRAPPSAPDPDRPRSHNVSPPSDKFKQMDVSPAPHHPSPGSNPTGRLDNFSFHLASRREPPSQPQENSSGELPGSISFGKQPTPSLTPPLCAAAAPSQ